MVKHSKAAKSRWLIVLLLAAMISAGAVAALLHRRGFPHPCGLLVYESISRANAEAGVSPRTLVPIPVHRASTSGADPLPATTSSTPRPGRVLCVVEGRTFSAPAPIERLSVMATVPIADPNKPRVTVTVRTASGTFTRTVTESSRPEADDEADQEGAGGKREHVAQGTEFEVLGSRIKDAPREGIEAISVAWAGPVPYRSLSMGVKSGRVRFSAGYYDGAAVHGL